MGIAKSWHKIAANADEIFTSGNGIKEISVEGKHICLVKHSGKIFAISAFCPHAGGTLAEGYTDALGNIVCPKHHYRFQLSSGRNISGEGYQLKTYSIQEKEDGLYVGW